MFPVSKGNLNDDFTAMVVDNRFGFDKVGILSIVELASWKYGFQQRSVIDRFITERKIQKLYKLLAKHTFKLRKVNGDYRASIMQDCQLIINGIVNDILDKCEKFGINKEKLKQQLEFGEITKETTTYYVLSMSNPIRPKNLAVKLPPLTAKKQMTRKVYDLQIVKKQKHFGYHLSNQHKCYKIHCSSQYKICF